MLDGLIALSANIPSGWRVVILSMLPVIELRGAIPLGLLWGLDLWQAFCWAILGNFLPIIPLLLMLDWLLRALSSCPALTRPLARLTQPDRAREEKIRRYGMPALTLFVAIPLPGFGVWTGCLLAVVLDLPFFPALLAITLGEVLSGIVVALAVSGVLAVTQWQHGGWLLLAIAVALIIFRLCRRKKMADQAIIS